MSEDKGEQQEQFEQLDQILEGRIQQRVYSLIGSLMIEKIRLEEIIRIEQQRNTPKGET